MEEITFDMAKQALLDAIAHRGEDYVYQKPEGEPSCLYVHTDSEGNKAAGCGVGLALSLLGVPLSVMEEHNQLRWTAFSKEAGIKTDLKAEMLFDYFQDRQDMRLPWGKSCEGALRYVASFSE